MPAILDFNIQTHDFDSAASAFSVFRRFLGSWFLTDWTASVWCALPEVLRLCFWPGVS